MKIPKSKGVPTPLVGIVLFRQSPISLQSMHSSKTHSSVERAKKASLQALKNEGRRFNSC